MNRVHILEKSLFNIYLFSSNAHTLRQTTQQKFVCYFCCLPLFNPQHNVVSMRQPPLESCPILMVVKLASPSLHKSILHCTRQVLEAVQPVTIPTALFTVISYSHSINLNFNYTPHNAGCLLSNLLLDILPSTVICPRNSLCGMQLWQDTQSVCLQHIFSLAFTIPVIP